MALTSGARFGRYEILGLLGAGGMGEVYHARDSILHRDVALKVLPDGVTSDPDRLARLTREAQLLASLSHSNIAGVYGLEEGLSPQSSPALAMELVQGQTLADRIAQEAIPFDEALAIARQIADALEAAHQQGIVHRDLKPANIKLRPDGSVKVLDFGLAKLTEARTASGHAASRASGPDAAALTASPTVMSPAMVTGAGVILGTAAYMSPEQARGREVDRRADIWAFGVVLYEMLTARRAFDGDSVTEVAGAVIHKDPDWHRLPLETPARVRVVLERCLAKDPRQRFRDIGDVRLMLDGAFEVAVPPAPSLRRGWRRVALFAVSALAIVTASGTAAWWLTKPAPADATAVRFSVSPPPQAQMGPFFALSPDGRYLAFLGQESGMQRLWVHSFESGDTRVLLRAGIVTGAPFWSPDSRWIGFAGEGRLRKIDPAGGSAEQITEVAPFAGATWSDNDQIVFAMPTRGLFQVSADGLGAPRPLTTVDASRQEVSHTGPWFLPGGRRFLYLRSSSEPGASGIYAGTLDTPPDAQDLTRILSVQQNALYAPDPGTDRGHLFFMRDRVLVAQPFDPSTLALTGEPGRLADELGTGPGGTSSYGFFSVSNTGALVYRRAQSTIGSAVWVTRNGLQAGAIATGIDRPQNPQLSPDGERLALIANGDLWVYDVDGRPPIRLSSGGTSYSPLWSRDGRRVAFEANSLVVGLPADGSDLTPQPLSPAQGHYHPHGWSPDGDEIVLVALPGPTKTSDILRFSLRTQRAPEPVVATPAAEGGPGAALSPDGRWLAYVSDQTGRAEVWVRPYPGPGAPVRVSPNAGVEPVWSRDGKELYYREPTQLMMVGVNTSGGFDFTAATPLFAESRFVHIGQPPTYDVAGDGRFVMIMSADAATAPFNVVLNWAAALRSSSVR